MPISRAHSKAKPFVQQCKVIRANDLPRRVVIRESPSRTLPVADIAEIAHHIFLRLLCTWRGNGGVLQYSLVDASRSGVGSQLPLRHVDIVVDGDVGLLLGCECVVASLDVGTAGRADVGKGVVWQELICGRMDRKAAVAWGRVSHARCELVQG